MARVNLMAGRIVLRY